ncbi:hypothetical protein [Methylocystis sp. MJC1]|uniref:hypothetical protein n=1 Tax=Methylocystis sp. MJC1 TaxID=2654282 RepID=UPI0019D0C534|nr:hypothetical protein [Methylocystis sp. MJC1]
MLDRQREQGGALMAFKSWSRLPTGWIENGGLKSFRWEKGKGPNNAAALMMLMVISHHADLEGAAALTDELMQATYLSRTKTSAGLDVLEDSELVVSDGLKRSRYKIVDLSIHAVGQTPRETALCSRRDRCFSGISTYVGRRSWMRSNFIFLAAALRNFATSIANMSYEKITEYWGIERARIKSGLSFWRLLASFTYGVSSG